MYIMYVDESGDPGSAKGSSEHFILSGLILNYKDWQASFKELKRFRKNLWKKYGLDMDTEIHAHELLRIDRNKAYRNIHKSGRIEILKTYAQLIPAMLPNSKVINVCLNKSEFETGTDIVQLAWTRLINLYDAFLKRIAHDEGIIIADDSNEMPLRSLLGKLRIYNPSPSRLSGELYDSKITSIIEDIFYKESSTSYFIQTVDVIAYLLSKRANNQKSIKKFQIDLLFDLITPILLEKYPGK